MTDPRDPRRPRRPSSDDGEGESDGGLDHGDQGEDLKLKLLRSNTSLIRKEEHFLSGMFHIPLEGVETKVRQSILTLTGLRDLEARRKSRKRFQRIWLSITSQKLPR